MTPVIALDGQQSKTPSPFGKSDNDMRDRTKEELLIVIRQQTDECHRIKRKLEFERMKHQHQIAEHEDSILTITDELKAEKLQLEAKHSRAITQLREEQGIALTQLREEHQSELSKQADAILDREAQIQKYITAIGGLERNNCRLTLRHEDELRRLAVEHEDELSRFAVEHENELHLLVLEHKEKLQSNESRWQHQHSDLVTLHRDKFRILQDMFWLKRYEDYDIHRTIVLYNLAILTIYGIKQDPTFCLNHNICVYHFSKYEQHGLGQSIPRSRFVILEQDVQFLCGL
jgi:hypothetical protein